MKKRPGNPNLHKHGFAANPQNINKKGRPKKSWGVINEMLQQKGVVKLEKRDLLDGYALIFNCTEEELDEILDDDETPFALKAMISSMTDKKFRDQALRDYRDYAFGKSHSNVEVSFKEQPLFPGMDHRKELSGRNKGQELGSRREIEKAKVLDIEYEEIPNTGSKEI